MNKAELIKIINIANIPDFEVEPDRVMEAYHRLDDLNEHHLSELIDDYILGKLDLRRTIIFEEHLLSCRKCRKELATTRVFIKGVKEFCDDNQ